MGKMWVVILRHEYSVPNNYSWSVFAMPPDTQPFMWQLQGHAAVEMDETEAQELLAAQRKIIGLQVKLGTMWNNHEKDLAVQLQKDKQS